MKKIKEYSLEEFMWNILIGFLKSLPHLIHEVTLLMIVIIALAGILWKVTNELLTALLIWGCKQLIHMSKNFYFYTIYMYRYQRKRKWMFYK